MKFVYVNFYEKEPKAANDLKGLAEVTGLNYHNLVYYLRDSDYYIREWKFIVMRIRDIKKSNRGGKCKPNGFKSN